MKKEIKIILSFLIAVTVLLLSFYLATNVSDKEEGSNLNENGEVVLNETMSPEDKEVFGLENDKDFIVTGRDENGKITAYKKNYVEEEPEIELMTDSDKQEILIDASKTYEVLSRDENGKVEAYRVVDNVEKIEVKYDFMTNDEMKERLLDERGIYQVLSRDEEGEILSYKVINTREDLLTEYGNYTFVE